MSPPTNSAPFGVPIGIGRMSVARTLTPFSARQLTTFCPMKPDAPNTVTSMRCPFSESRIPNPESDREADVPAARLDLGLVARAPRDQLREPLAQVSPRAVAAIGGGVDGPSAPVADQLCLA